MSVDQSRLENVQLWKRLQEARSTAAQLPEDPLSVDAVQRERWDELFRLEASFHRHNAAYLEELAASSFRAQRCLAVETNGGQCKFNEGHHGPHQSEDCKTTWRNARNPVRLDGTPWP